MDYALRHGYSVFRFLATNAPWLFVPGPEVALAGRAIRPAMSADDLALAYRMPHAFLASEASATAVAALNSKGIFKGAVDAFLTGNGQVYIGFSRDAANAAEYFRPVGRSVGACFKRHSWAELPAIQAAINAGEQVRLGVSFARYVDSGNPLAACNKGCSKALENLNIYDAVGR